VKAQSQTKNVTETCVCDGKRRGLSLLCNAKKIIVNLGLCTTKFSQNLLLCSELQSLVFEADRFQFSCRSVRAGCAKGFDSGTKLTPLPWNGDLLHTRRRIRPIAKGSAR
jgi:hypothetical protein